MRGLFIELGGGRLKIDNLFFIPSDKRLNGNIGWQQFGMYLPDLVRAETMRSGKQQPRILIVLVTASYCAWLLHSEAVRGFLANLQRLLHKFLP